MLNRLATNILIRALVNYASTFGQSCFVRSSTSLLSFVMEFVWGEIIKRLVHLDALETQPSVCMRTMVWSTASFEFLTCPLSTSLRRKWEVMLSLILCHQNLAQELRVLMSPFPSPSWHLKMYGRFSRHFSLLYSHQISSWNSYLADNFVVL